MANLVEQLQRDSLETSIPVSSLLRRVKLTAAKLNLTQVKEWVELELNGYTKTVPDYRMLSGRPMAFNPYQGWIHIVGEISDLVSTMPIRQSIGSIENLGAAGTNNSCQIHYPADVTATINESCGGHGFPCALHIGRSQIVGLLDRVRTLVLEWALSLEKSGVVGSEFSFSAEERQKAQEGQLPTISIGHIGSFNGNLGAGNTTGNIQTTKIDTSGLLELVNQIRDRSAELVTCGVDGSDLDKRLSAIEIALKSGTSSEGVLSGLVADLRNTVSGASGNLIATGVLAALQPYIGALGS